MTRLTDFYQFVDDNEELFKGVSIGKGSNKEDAIIALANRIDSLEAELKRAQKEKPTAASDAALTEEEKNIKTFQVALKAVTRLSDEVKSLQAELARHAWHRIDPDDEGTWPEDGKHFLFRIVLNNRMIDYQKCQRLGPRIETMRNSGCYRLDRGFATHCRRIVGPEELTKEEIEESLIKGKVEADAYLGKRSPEDGG